MGVPITAVVSYFFYTMFLVGSRQGVSLLKRQDIIVLQNPDNCSEEFQPRTCSKGRRLPLPSPRKHWESHLSFWTVPRSSHSPHQRTLHMEAYIFKEVHSEPNITHKSYTNWITIQNRTSWKLTCKSTCWVWPQNVLAFYHNHSSCGHFPECGQHREILSNPSSSPSLPLWNRH